MSHTTKIKSAPIRDIAALKAAVEELQEQGVRCELVEGENIAPRMYYDRQEDELRGKTPYVLKLEDSQFDVGFIEEEDGTYTPVTDFHANEVERQIGATCGCSGSPKNDAERAERALGGLMQKYTKHATINAIASQGYFVEDLNYDEATGEITLTYNT